MGYSLSLDKVEVVCVMCLSVDNLHEKTFVHQKSMASETNQRSSASVYDIMACWATRPVRSTIYADNSMTAENTPYRPCTSMNSQLAARRQRNTNGP
jgi:hypothetical protein